MYFEPKGKTGNGAVMKKSLVSVMFFARVLLTEAKTVSHSTEGSYSLLPFVGFMAVRGQL